MGRHLSPGCSESPAGAEAETGVASASSGVDCVFLAFTRSFPGGGSLKSSTLSCVQQEIKGTDPRGTPGRRSSTLPQT